MSPSVSPPSSSSKLRMKFDTKHLATATESTLISTHTRWGGGDGTDNKSPLSEANERSNRKNPPLNTSIGGPAVISRQRWIHVLYVMEVNELNTIAIIIIVLVIYSPGNIVVEVDVSNRTLTMSEWCWGLCYRPNTLQWHVHRTIQ